MSQYTKEEMKAIETVQQLISDYRTNIEGITLVKEEFEDDLDPVMVEGETDAGYAIQMFVSPKDIAPILLQYEYPIFAVLDEEPPQAMWDELARKFGIARVLSVDL